MSQYFLHNRTQMFKLRNFYNFMHKMSSIQIYYLLQFAKGLNIFWTWACLAWCSISSSFQNSLKTSEFWSYEFLECYCWNLDPFLSDISFQLLKSSWLFFKYFSFNDAPNILYRWKIWTAGWPIQHPYSSTTKPCCCNSCIMWFCIVLLEIHKTFPEIDVVWRGAYVALKHLYAFQHS